MYIALMMAPDYITVYEVVDNSIDEALAGYCKTLLLKLILMEQPSDDGRGIL